jgi:hypothetical protein
VALGTKCIGNLHSSIIKDTVSVLGSRELGTLCLTDLDVHVLVASPPKAIEASLCNTILCEL